MNYRKINKFLSEILILVAIAMLPSTFICLFDGETKVALSFLYSILIAVVLSVILKFISRKQSGGFHSREGLVCVSLSWILISLIGCLPFFFSRQIPSFIDALFEIVSGFTTTGASILPDVESLSRGLLFWRSFSHWMGGMGVLVLLMVFVPKSDHNTGSTMHLLRAESPGPNVGKLVPSMKKTALALYGIYMALTVLDFIFLIAGGMPLFDSVCTAFGTAGTGGFGIKNDSMAGYSPYIQNVTTVFMLLFGINFSCYYLILTKRFISVLKDEELRAYLGLFIGATSLIAFNIYNMYSGISETLRHAAFQVSTIMTTTGFATTDFDKWPVFSKTLLLCLMFIGSSAGSTAGGLKFQRLLLLIKNLKRHIRQTLYPNKVQIVRMNGEKLNEKILESTNLYLIGYTFIIVTSFLLISIDGFSITSNMSAVISCFNNIGPGLEAVGPACNFSGYSVFSKLVLIFDMLAGRLEILPLLGLLSLRTWKRK
ncbi:MAG: TrkH family potassium uptake protein [Lachnospiraceae bacterium]|nr:TrkH family potassium uptake protein [Lachnospiraceae bacterium]